MEHPCQRCGTAVEDGRPFCPQCRAPQIHVQVAAPDASIVPSPDGATGGFSPQIKETGGAPAGGAVDRRSAIRAAVKAGVLGVFIGMIPFLGMVLTGALAVFLYRREKGFALPVGLASRLGGAAGVVAFAINAVLITIQIFIFHAQQRYTDNIITIAQKLGGNVGDPELQASIHNLFTPAGLAITFFFGMILSIVLASAGGALASLFLRPNRPRV